MISGNIEGKVMGMVKRFLPFYLFTLLPLTAWSQTKLTAEQQKEIVAKVDKSASAMTQMQCEFSQTKSMKLL